MRLRTNRLTWAVVVFAAMTASLAVQPSIGSASSGLDLPKAGRCSSTLGGVEDRIAAFWKCTDSLASNDILFSEDLGQWAVNLIERDASARIRVIDFRSSTAGMQKSLDVASAGVPPSPPKTQDVEARIAAFWKRVDALDQCDLLGASDLGGWALNVIDRGPSRRITVADFRSSSSAMQTGLDRAKAPCPFVPTPPVATNLCGAPPNPWGYNFCGRGGFVVSPPSNFCAYFGCIANFWNGVGYVIQCRDGMFSKSGGRSGSCSSHGGNSRPLYSN